MTSSTIMRNLEFVLIFTCWVILFDISTPYVAAQNDINSNNTTTTTTTINSSASANDDPIPPPVPSPISVPAPLTTPTPVAITAAECPLMCNNGGECKKGNSDFSNHPKETGKTPFTFQQTTNRQGWYCECPEGFTGLRCNRHYEICPKFVYSGFVDNSSSIASNIVDSHYCYHGGKCIDGLTDGSHSDIDDTERFCDCSNAQHNGVLYFGKYCEIEGAVRCDPNSQIFCTAQGSCADDYENKVHPCDCKQGHRGPHCEFILGSVPECLLPCGGATVSEDGGSVDNSLIGGIGECTLGIKDFETARYQDFWESHDGNFQYCKCPENWFGDNCDTPGVVCGNAHCFNGGSCLQTLNTNGETTSACDCRVAGHNGFSYAGQYCENVESDNCDAAATAAADNNNSKIGSAKQHANGKMFCTNGGTCKDANNPHLGCNCPGAHFGPICEYHKQEDGECSLKCQNDGQCRTGLKDNSLIEKLGKEMSAYNATKHSEVFEHCVCPSGFFGIQCEHKLEICPGGDHVCLHGSQCVAQNEGGSDGDEMHHTCDCDHAFDAVERYAGKFCQYTSTDICTRNGQPGMGKANFAFCVNNGLCKGKVNDGEDPPGCTCPEGYTGVHCEYLLPVDNERFDDDDSISNGGGGGYSTNSDVPTVSKDLSPSSSSTTESGVLSSDAKENGLVVALSLVVVLIVVLIALIIMRPFFCDHNGESTDDKMSADVQAALAEEEAASNSVTTTSQSNKIGTTQGDDDSLEDVEDYVNNNSNILTDNELEHVQIV